MKIILYFVSLLDELIQITKIHVEFDNIILMHETSKGK